MPPAGLVGQNPPTWAAASRLGRADAAQVPPVYYPKNVKSAGKANLPTRAKREAKKADRPYLDNIETPKAHNQPKKDNN